MRTAITGGVLVLMLAGCGASGGTTTGGKASYHHTVGYSVLSTDGITLHVHVNYTDSSGVSQNADASPPAWNQSVEFDRQVPTVVLNGTTPDISPTGGLGGVECIIQFDGKTVSQHTGRGEAICSYNLPPA